MEALTILVTGLVDWITNHWFLTFLLLCGFESIYSQNEEGEQK